MTANKTLTFIQYYNNKGNYTVKYHVVNVVALIQMAAKSKMGAKMKVLFFKSLLET